MNALVDGHTIEHACAGKDGEEHQECFVSRFLPELTEIVETHPFQSADAVETMFRKTVCATQCPYPDRTGYCPLRDSGQCCLSANFPHVVDQLQLQAGFMPMPPAPHPRRRWWAAVCSPQAWLISVVLIALLFAAPAVQMPDPVLHRPGPVVPEQPWASMSGLKLRTEAGRTMTLEQFASSQLAFITGAPAWQGEAPVLTLLSVMAEPMVWRSREALLIPSDDLRALLGLPAGATHVSYDALMQPQMLERLLLPMVRRASLGQKLSAEERDAFLLYARAAALQQLFAQEVSLVPPRAGRDGAWHPVLQPDQLTAEQQVGLKRAWSAMLSAVRRGERAAIASSSDRLAGVIARLGESPSLLTTTPQWGARLPF